MNDIVSHLFEHQNKADNSLYLIPSENSLSRQARLAYASDIISRYYFPTANSSTWAFPGNDAIAPIYNICERLLKERTGAKWISIKPISGASSMTIGITSMSRVGDTIATIHPRNGGHTITKLQTEALGRHLQHLPFLDNGLDENIAALPEFYTQHDIQMVYLDRCHMLFPYQLEALRKHTPQHIPIYYDGSHVMGLLFGNRFNKPLIEGATVLSGSTHKTIPGPHKAFIATNDDELAISIANHASSFVSHDHPADTAALAITLLEMQDEWESYADKTIHNAQTLASQLHKHGLPVLFPERNFTECHQIWIDTFPAIDAYEAVMKLAQCGIITNTFYAPTVPDRLSMRIGVQEITYLGATTEHIARIATAITDCLYDRASTERLTQSVAEIRQELHKTVDGKLLEQIQNLLKS